MNISELIRELRRLFYLYGDAPVCMVIDDYDERVEHVYFETDDKEYILE